MKVKPATAKLLRDFVELTIAEASEEQAQYLIATLRIACKVAMEHEDDYKHGK